MCVKQTVTPSSSRRHLRVAVKFFIAVSLLVVALVVVAVVGMIGVARTNRHADTLFSDNIQTVAAVAGLADTLHEVEVAALELIPAASEQQRARLNAELDLSLIPAARQAIEATRAADPNWRATLDSIDAGLTEFIALRDTGAYSEAGTSADILDQKGELAQRTKRIFDPLTSAADERFDAETLDAAMAKHDADHSYRVTLLTLAASVVLAMLAALMIVIILSRNMVPRIRRYSQFATEIAAGHSTDPLVLSGTDELADLGAALNAMVDHRAALASSEARQAEFVDTLQVTSTEEEAHELIKRHLERSIDESSVVVLQRNNSANRLEAATSTNSDAELSARLVGAEPRACLALRFARTHSEGDGVAPLLGCALCAERAANSTCEPLLVGGEVIGAVLVSHQTRLGEEEGTRIKTSVAQAAPVLANLRNLALAEFRANNDSLTGLPNKRATDDTLKRMVAQANRSITPLAAIMMDLDHFKRINDQYGHGKGDEVLAAVGAVLQACLRGSDFAGRFGGEEFLILLPETDLEGAEQVAEKIRATIEEISVTGIELNLTASLGIAQLLEHAGSANGLVREADHALYAAKTAGRNRTITADRAITDRETEAGPGQRTMDALTT